MFVEGKDKKYSCWDCSKRCLAYTSGRMGQCWNCKDGSLSGGFPDQPRQTPVWLCCLCLGPREDKLRANHIPTHVLVVLHMLEQNTLKAVTTMLLLHIG